MYRNEEPVPQVDFCFEQKRRDSPPPYIENISKLGDLIIETLELMLEPQSLKYFTFCIILDFKIIHHATGKEYIKFIKLYLRI